MLKAYLCPPFFFTLSKHQWSFIGKETTDRCLAIYNENKFKYFIL